MKRIFVMFLMALLIMGIAISANAEEVRYAEPQLAWVSVSQASVRTDPTAETAPMAQLKNGQYCVVLGKTEVDNKEYFIIDMTFLGCPGDFGYVLRKSLHLGIKEYVKTTGETWAYAQESTAADGVAQLSAGQQRLVLGETQVAGESWLAIQVDPEGDRGVGYVPADDVSARYVAQEDELLLAEVRAGRASLLASVGMGIVLDKETVTATTDGYVTVSSATQVLASGSSNAKVIGNLNAGDKVYVYQSGEQYTMIVFNNSFGYVVNDSLK